jgi:hypothetical protein
MILPDPTSLQKQYTVDGHVIEYRGLMELVQGGPEVGDLFVDGCRVGGTLRFGGPLIPYQGAIYVPVYSKGLFSSGFVLARVDLTNGQVAKLGKRQGLIYLSKIEDDIVYYYTDIDQTRAKAFTLTPAEGPSRRTLS